MSMEVNCKAEFESEKENLTAADLKLWLDNLPPEARVQAIIRDFGSQRDPDERLVGIRATWVEER